MRKEGRNTGQRVHKCEKRPLCCFQEWKVPVSSDRDSNPNVSAHAPCIVFTHTASAASNVWMAQRRFEHYTVINQKQM